MKVGAAGKQTAALVRGLAWTTKTLVFGCLASVAASRATTPADSRPYFAHGAASAVRKTSDRVTFELYRQNSRFRVDSHSGSTLLFAMAQAVDASTDALEVEYDPGSGVVSGDDPKPSFAVISITHNGQRVMAAAASEPERPHQGGAAAAFARGVAELEAGYYSDAVRYLDTALEGTLPPRVKAAAFKVRGSAVVRQVEFWESRVPTPEGDQRLAAALKDLIEWARREPNDPQARYEIAAVFRGLGAYDEAIALYTSIRSDWANERYWPAIRVGATLREQGRYEWALKSLDGLADAEGPQTGMAFHYHRGWTLLDLGRPAEAVTELTSGIEMQPDYAWAYVKRGCAYALLGQRARALEDQRTALKRITEAPMVTPADKFNLKRLRAVEQSLAQDVALSRSTPDPEVCGGYWHDANQPRTRSAYVPANPLPTLPKPPNGRLGVQ